MERIIETLLDYAIQHHLMDEYDRNYARNRILTLLKEETWIPCDSRISYTHVSELLEKLCAIGIANGALQDRRQQRDAFDSALMDCVMMRPSQVIERFRTAKSEKAATDTFYAFSKDSNYIRTNRIEQNISYAVESEFGTLDITINCSKPEKDPRDIAHARENTQDAYPTCVLCKENEGYYGNASRDGRSNIRLIPIMLQDEHWYFQYSPYVYYKEHCIVLNGQHAPMKTDRKTFERLLSFVDILPHYFLGSNADLPIVGGSILSHDHYQGGSYTFAMAKAEILESYDCFMDMGVEAYRLYWPLSVLRLSGKDKDALVEVADMVLRVWRMYSDEACDIFAHTKEDHNTISTIARKNKDNFELDLVLRNNRTTKQYPFGIFHPHEEIHHIKKENIGIIEVMGLAVLPARLKRELTEIREYLLTGEAMDQEVLQAHQAWIASLQKKYTFTKENCEQILREEVGTIFIEGLMHCGVFKLNEAGKEGFARFIAVLKAKKEENTYGN